MKKVRNIYIYITFLLSFFISVQNVFADLPDSYTKLPTPSNTEPVGNYYFDEDGDVHTFGNYHQKVESNGVSGRQDDDKDIFCLDMSLKGGTNLIAWRTLEPDDPDSLYDRGIIYIANSDADYRAKITALRAFVTLIPPYRKFYLANDSYGSSQLDPYVALINSAVDWATDFDNETLKKVFGQFCYDRNFYTDSSTSKRQHIINHLYGDNVYPEYKATAFWVMHSNGNEELVDGIFDKANRLDESNPYVAKSKELFQEAIRVSAGQGDYNDNKSFAFPEQPTSFTDVITVDPNLASNTVDYQRQIVFKVTFNKFNENKEGTLTLKINPDVDNTASLKLVEMLYRKQGETNWTKFTESTDFLPLITKSSETFEIAAVVKANVHNSENVTVNFEVTPTYFTKSLGSGKIYIPGGDNANNYYNQRFVIAEGNSSGPSPQSFPKKFKVKWNKDLCKSPPNTSNTQEYSNYIKKCCFADGSGNSLEEKCQRNNTDNACDTFKNYCEKCAGTVSVPTQCSEFAGGEVPKCTDGADAVVSDPNDILVCVLNNNKYELSRDGAANQYCKIYCTEDYKIGMPLGKWVESGKSFTVDVTLNGTKTCYTSEILYDQFKNDLKANITLIDDAKKVVDEYQDLVNRANQSIASVQSWAEANLDYWITVPDPDECVPSSATYIDQNSLCTTSNGKRGTWQSRSHTERNPVVTDDYIRNELNRRLESAKQDYESKIKSYSEKQLDFNNCTTLYNNNASKQHTLFDIKTNEKVSFEYSDNYNIGKGLKKADLVKKTTGSYPAVVQTTTTWLCDSDVDTYYNVCKGTISSTGKKENISYPDCLNNNCNGDNWYQNKAAHPTTTITKTKYGKISSSYAALYVPTEQFAADLSGIKLRKRDITNLINVTNPVSANSPQLAQKGYHKIVRRVYVNGEEVEQQIFPIKLSTEKGAYTYNVKFNGIGEHFNNGATGRLIGDSDSLASNKQFTGDYYCAYVVDCTKCKVTSNGGTVIQRGFKIVTPDITKIEVEIDKHCKGCSVIWGSPGENGGFQPTIRQISLNDVNPSDRGLGYNLLNLKGVQAVKEIENNGESIYNDKGVTYQVTLTPKVIETINNYVKTNKGNNIITNNFNYSKYVDKCKTYTSLKGYNNRNDKEKALNKYDYLICESGLLDLLKDTKDAKVTENFKYTSWLDSEYCIGNDCVIGSGFGYGNVFGPAYK